MSHRERLAALDSCAVSDALDRLGLRGVVAGIGPLTGPGRISGRVVTVRLVEARGRVASRHLCTDAIEAAEPGDVLVVEHRSRDDCAGWGGLLSWAARAKGLAGTIVDGAVRDVDESREAAYPVFARKAVPATARGRVVEEAHNVPVDIGGIAVRPGDFVIADGSGVVFIEESRLEDVISTAESIAERESAMTEAVKQGKPVSSVLGGAYERMLDHG